MTENHDTEKPLRKYLVQWSQASTDLTTVVEAANPREARAAFRAKTHRLGYGVSIQRITLAP